MSTKTMVGVVCALAAVLAPPAYAQTTSVAVSGSYTPIAAHSAHRNWDVYVNGRYVGRDPDPTIRSQLAHDPCQGGGC